MGIAPELARGAVRLSFGAGNDAGEVKRFIAALQATVGDLRGLTAIEAGRV
jgi:cysteine desulfurase